MGGVRLWAELNPMDGENPGHYVFDLPFSFALDLALLPITGALALGR